MLLDAAAFVEAHAMLAPGDEQRVGRMSIVQEGPERAVRMAHLGAVGSFSINGVAELQSELPWGT